MSAPTPILDYAPVEEKTYRCGALSYTRRTLFALFGGLLWGDFCFTMIERVLPRVLPLELKQLHVSNTFMAFVMSTIPAIMDIGVGPFVSYKSDRYRGSKMGRRIPFILHTLPFMVLSLAMIGWSEPIANWLQRVAPAVRHVAPVTLTVVVLVAFVVAFHFFNNFVGCVYYYLFNDVVPPQLLGRFNGLFRIVGNLTTALFNGFIFQYSETHFRQIMTGVAILYLLGMTIMCLRVKEGPYPPPPQDEQFTGFFGKLRSVGQQSFTTRFYWYFYLTSACGAMAGAPGIFNVFVSKQMNLTLKQQGTLAMIGGVGGIVATYYASVFVDRWHPLRINTYNAIGGAFNAFNGWIWLFITLPSSTMFWTSLIGTLTGEFSGALGGLCGIAMFMRLMPRSLYGQFSAANSVIRAAGALLAGVMAGGFLDLIRLLLRNSVFAHNFGPDFYYRFSFLWSGSFAIAGTVFTCLAYREWLRLGGDEHYLPPAPWLPEGREPAAAQFKSVSSIPAWLRVSLVISLLSIPINLIFMICFTREMLHIDSLARVGRWHLMVWFPVKLALSAVVVLQYVSIFRDIRKREGGRKTRMGLPHHGILMVGALTGLASFPNFWLQTQWLINLHLPKEIQIISISNLIGVALGIGYLQMIRWIERDIPEAAKFDPAATAFPPVFRGAEPGGD